MRADAELIKNEVQDTMADSMQTFDFHQIIDLTEKLTAEQKAWAKQNVDWKVYIIGKEQHEQKDTIDKLSKIGEIPKEDRTKVCGIMMEEIVKKLREAQPYDLHGDSIKLIADELEDFIVNELGRD